MLVFDVISVPHILCARLWPSINAPLSLPKTQNDHATVQETCKQPKMESLMGISRSVVAYLRTAHTGSGPGRLAVPDVPKVRHRGAGLMLLFVSSCVSGCGEPCPIALGEFAVGVVPSSVRASLLM